jgi:hypothetical protein
LINFIRLGLRAVLRALSDDTEARKATIRRFGRSDDARYGQVLFEKQPTANQCDGLFFFQVGATRRL